MLLLSLSAFAAEPVDLFGEGAASPAVAVSGAGDVDLDDFDDLLITTETVDNEVGVWWVPGGAAGPDVDRAVSFSSISAAFPLSSRDRATAIGDFNGDGYVDVLVTNRGYKGVGAFAIHLGSAVGPSPTPSVWTVDGAGPTVAALGDLDADGRDDFAIASSAGVSIFRGGRLTVRARVAAPGAFDVVGFAAKDGTLGGDLMVMTDEGATIGVSVFPRTSTFGWGAPTRLWTGSSYPMVKHLAVDGDEAVAVVNDARKTRLFVSSLFGVVELERGGCTGFGCGTDFAVLDTGAGAKVVLATTRDLRVIDVYAGTAVDMTGTGYDTFVENVGDTDGDGVDDLILGRSRSSGFATYWLSGLAVR